MTETRIWLSPPDVGELERKLLLEAFDSNWVAPVGPDLDAFEAQVAELVFTSAIASGLFGSALLGYQFVYPVIRGPHMHAYVPWTDGTLKDFALCNMSWGWAAMGSGSGRQGRSFRLRLSMAFCR